MARTLETRGVNAAFSPDGSRIILHPSVEGVTEIRITAVFLHGYWQFKGWGFPNRLPLNGSMIDGQMIQLIEIDPSDLDLYTV